MKRTFLKVLALAAAMAAATCASAAPLTIAKTLATSSDPIDVLNPPKAIPGAVITYTLTVRNPNLATTAKNVVITDSITTATPANAEYYVGLNDANPFVYIDGLLGLLGTTGLTYTWGGVNSASDSVDFSCDGGSTWGCTVHPGADGYDPAVTNIRITFSNNFPGSTGFTFAIRARVKQ
ncbi:MAG: hypothetical protein WDN06_05530 [Asticcacaulis sp.]